MDPHGLAHVLEDHVAGDLDVGAPFDLQTGDRGVPGLGLARGAAVEGQPPPDDDIVADDRADGVPGMVRALQCPFPEEAGARAEPQPRNEEGPPGGKLHDPSRGQLLR